ncbi:MAG: cytochrome c [Acidobacteriota bacterium]|nr:cytochrome c [Acidobacteriota bacterium]
MSDSVRRQILTALLAVTFGAAALQAQNARGGRGGRGASGAGQRPVDIAVTTYFDQTHVASGLKVFSAHCASCHGEDARGGKGKTDIDLIRSAMVLDDIGGQEIGEFLKYGRPEKNMPKFDLPTADVADLATWLHYSIVSAGERGSYKRPNVMSGDAKKGEAFFNGTVGKCSTCHSSTGDMKGLAARYDDEVPTIQSLIVSGGGRFGRGGRGRGAAAGAGTATVTLQSGEKFQGAPVTEDEFVVSIRLADGQIRSWFRKDGWPKYSAINPLQAHVDLQLKYTDDDIHNLAAYLISLR